jgi:hypothetical protein
MTSDEIKNEILKLSSDEQKQLIIEILKAVMPVVCTDKVCLNQIRGIVDEITVKKYRDQHMGNI